MNLLHALQDANRETEIDPERACWDIEMGDTGAPTAAYVVASYDTIGQRDRRGYRVQGVSGASGVLATHTGSGCSA